MSETKISFLKSLKLGAHQSYSKNIYETIKNSINNGMYSTQFFLGSTNLWKRNETKEEEIKKSLEIIEKFPINVFTHFPYTSNLCGSKNSLAWNGDLTQDNKTISIIKFVEKEVNLISNFNLHNCCSGVVIHPGSYSDRKAGLQAISKSINKINFNEKAKLLLENTAGQGDTLAIDFQELKEIYDKVDRKKKKNIGICIDTCHIFASGLYNLSLIEEVDRLFTDFISTFEIDKFNLLHLNDSQKEFGSRVDRHAPIGFGYIWGNDISSLVYLLNKCKIYNIPIILETCYSDIFTISSIENEFLI